MFLPPLSAPSIVDLKKLEYGPGTICGGFPSSLGLGARRQSYSNFVASGVNPKPFFVGS